jgi:hypothetical protein
MESHDSIDTDIDLRLDIGQGPVKITRLRASLPV